MRWLAAAVVELGVDDLRGAGCLEAEALYSGLECSRVCWAVVWNSLGPL